MKGSVQLCSLPHNAFPSTATNKFFESNFSAFLSAQVAVSLATAECVQQNKQSYDSVRSFGRALRSKRGGYIAQEPLQPSFIGVDNHEECPDILEIGRPVIEQAQMG